MYATIIYKQQTKQVGEKVYDILTVYFLILNLIYY